MFAQDVVRQDKVYSLIIFGMLSVIKVVVAGVVTAAHV